MSRLGLGETPRGERVEVVQLAVLQVEVCLIDWTFHDEATQLLQSRRFGL